MVFIGCVAVMVLSPVLWRFKKLDWDQALTFFIVGFLYAMDFLATEHF